MQYWKIMDLIEEKRNAKESASKAYNETMKGVFSEVKDKLETTIAGLLIKMIYYAYITGPVKGNYDPSKPDFETKLMDEVEKVVKLLDTQGKEAKTEMATRLMYKFMRYAFTAKWRLGENQDARACILILMDILVEDWARPQAEGILMAAVDKVEEKIEKPLMVDNIKGYHLLKEEYIKIAPRLEMGMIKEDACEVVDVLLKSKSNK